MRRAGDPSLSGALGGPIWTWLVGVPLAITFLVVFGSRTVGVVIRQAVARWTFQSVPGVVESSGMAERGRERSHWSEVSYRYTVLGKSYVGNRFTYDSDSRGVAWEQRQANAARPGDQVTVYYNPKDPSDSVLRLWEDPSLWVILLVMEPIFVLMLSVLWLFPQRLMRGDEIGGRPRPRKETTFDGIGGWGRFRRRGDTLSIRKPPMYWMRTVIEIAVVPFAVGFPLYIYIASVNDWVISGQGAAAAWWVTGGLLALCILLQLGRRGPRLTVNLGNRRVHVSGRRGRAELAFGDIEAWYLKWIPSPALWGGTGRALLFSIVDRGDKTIPLHVFLDDGCGREQANEALVMFARITQSKAKGFPSDRPEAQEEPPVDSSKPRFRSPFTGLRFPDLGAWLKRGDMC